MENRKNAEPKIVIKNQKFDGCFLRLLLENHPLQYIQNKITKACKTLVLLQKSPLEGRRKNTTTNASIHIGSCLLIENINII